MNYPAWVVPFLGSGWIIGIIAIIHVFVSHFAVGGGIFIALTEQLAYKRQDQRLYDYIKKHAKFFLVVTTLIGVVTGPGIWWSISLVSPTATHAVIKQFAWFWSTEYLVFAAEIATFFVYYNTFGRISARQHLTLAWLYCFISVLTLVIINGILTFMLTPGDWLHTRNVFDGFFNPTYWPSNFLRVLIMFGLSGMYALITSSWIKDEAFRAYMLRYSAKWFLPIFFLGPIVGFWYFYNIPQATINTIFTGIHTSGVGNFSILARAIYLSLILSGTIIVFAFVGPYLNPKGFSVRSAVFFLLCGLIVTGISEWSRELLRKPYVIYGYMYSNGVLRDQVPMINRGGFFNAARWAGPMSRDMQNPMQQGELMFRFQCMSCHTTRGYRGMNRFLGERDLRGIQGFLQTLRETDSKKNPYSGIMPPLTGSDQEVRNLALYLNTLTDKNAAMAK